MKNRLKPMGIRDILDSTFTILRENFWAFQGVIFKAFLPSLIILLFGIIVVSVYLIAISASTHIPLSDNRFWSELFSGSLVSTVFIILFGLILGAAFVFATIIGAIYFIFGNLTIYKSGFHHEKCSSKDAFAGIKTKRIKLFLVQVILFVLYYIVAIPGFIITITLTLISPLAGNIFSILNNILIAFIGFFFCLAPQVAVFEELDVIKSISRSFKLLAKHRWRIFWTFVLVYLLVYALSIITLGIIIIPIVFAVMLKNIILYILAGLLFIAGLFIFNILLSFQFGPTTAIYYDLLIRKEGYDLKLQMAETNKMEVPIHL